VDSLPTPDFDLDADVTRILGKVVGVLRLL
jgi:hypothetical protein